jgi:hypothetical protein
MMYSSNYLVRQWFYVSVDQLLLRLQCLAVWLCAVMVRTTNAQYSSRCQQWSLRCYWHERKRYTTKQDIALS